MAGILLLIIVVFFTDINRAIDIIETSLSYLSGNFSILILSFLTLILIIVITFGHLFLITYKVNTFEQTYNPNFMFADLKSTNEQKLYFLAMVLVLLWHKEIIKGLHIYAVALSTISWNYEEIDFLGPISAYLKAIFFHFGTVAFGSFFTSILQLFIFVLEFISKRIKKFN